MRRTFLPALACALAALPAGTAAAAPPELPNDHDHHSELVAYGEGVTRCAVDVGKPQTLITALDYPRWSFHGTTSCTAPLQQSGQATLTGGYTAPLCSGFRATCESSAGGFGTGPSGTVRYTVSLTAPFGQGWVAAPSHCSGVGTDNLTCAFTVDVGKYGPV